MFFATSDSDILFEQYQKQIQKEVSKTLDLKDLHYFNVDFEFGDLKQVISNTEVVAFVLVSEVASCHLGGCAAISDNINGESEYFDMLVIMDTNRSILKIKILDYFSDYGYEITSKKYLKKFEGKKVCDFSTKIDGIDGISGATISSYALENCLDLLCQHFGN